MPVTDTTLRVAGQLRDYLAKILDRISRDLVRAWTVAWDGLKVRLRTAITGLLEGRAKWPSQRDIARSKPWKAAMKAAERALGQLQRITRQQGHDAVQDMVTAAVAAHGQMIVSQYPPRTNPDVPTTTDAQTARIVRAADGRITRLTRDHPTVVTRAMVQQMLRGVRISSDPDTTVRRVMERLEAEHGSGLAKALLVVRTEVFDAHRAAAQAAQDAAADVLDGWVWLSRADSTTCISCWVMHGTVHPLKEPGPLDHPQGRCLRVPKTKAWRDLGFDRDEPDDAIPSGETLFRRLPHTIQLKIAGRKRLGMLNTNRVKWDELATRRTNPGWRPSYQATPLKDL